MAPLIRILARVVAGVFIGKGLFSQEAVETIFSDPAFDMAVGAVVWGGTEFFYFLAKRYGWST